MAQWTALGMCQPLTNQLLYGLALIEEDSYISYRLSKSKRVLQLRLRLSKHALPYKSQAAQDVKFERYSQTARIFRLDDQSSQVFDGFVGALLHEHYPSLSQRDARADLPTVLTNKANCIVNTPHSLTRTSKSA
jgi:hypothetical protein